MATICVRCDQPINGISLYVNGGLAHPDAGWCTAKLREERESLRAVVEALRNDAAQFAGDNERLLKALNRETVEEALTAIASLIAAVVAGRAYFNDDSVEIGRALLAALRSCHGAIPPLPPSADGDVMFPATETPRDGAGE